MRLLKLVCLVAVLPSLAAAAPTLSLFGVGSISNSATVAIGSPTFSLDINLNSDGMPVSGVQFSLTTSGPATVNYSSTPIVVYSGNPFVAGDAGLAPLANSAVTTVQETSFFKAAGADYPATASSFAVFQFNTSGLSAGTYVFTPNFGLFTNSTTILEQPSDFGSAGAFTLTLVPEPTTYGLLGVAGLGALGMFLTRKRSVRLS